MLDSHSLSSDLKKQLFYFIKNYLVVEKDVEALGNDIYIFEYRIRMDWEIWRISWEKRLPNEPKKKILYDINISICPEKNVLFILSLT